MVGHQNLVAVVVVRTPTPTPTPTLTLTVTSMTTPTSTTTFDVDANFCVTAETKKRKPSRYEIIFLLEKNRLFFEAALSVSSIFVS